METVLMILEAAALAAALSLDAFVASFAYGSNQIHIPFLSVQGINLVCSTVMGVSLLAGALIRPLIPEWLTTLICFLLLFVLGLIKLLDSFTKALIRKYNRLSREIRFHMFNFRFVLRLYADPEMADQDCSKTISPGEALSLAAALSLDGLAVGFGAALGEVNAWAVILCSLATNMLAVMGGALLGNRAARKASFNCTWIGGALLILLAFLKLL